MNSNRTDKMILEELILLADGVGKHFGSDCEVVIHDLRAQESDATIVYIVHGEVSGRSVGDGPSPIVLKTMQAVERGEHEDTKFSYMTKTKDGRVLKSTTIFIKGEDGKERYIFGINYDITRFSDIEEGIRRFIAMGEDEPKQEEEIPNTVNELLESLIEQSAALIGKQPALMTKDEKIRAIRFLNDAGAFLVTKSGDKIASYFGISKFTLYSYIDVNKKKGDYTCN